MAFVNIENSPISVQLDCNQTVTVPDGETWKVTIVGAHHRTANMSYNIKINGTIVLYPGIDNHSNSISCILVGGDNVTTYAVNSTYPVTAHISGFIVQQQ